jgi:hypothetical protein
MRNWWPPLIETAIPVMSIISVRSGGADLTLVADTNVLIELFLPGASSEAVELCWDQS